MLNLPGYRITTQIYESTHSLVYRARRVADEAARRGGEQRHLALFDAIT